MLAMTPWLVVITVVLLMWALSPPRPASVEVRLRKHGYLPSTRHVADLNKPFSQRVVGPALENLAAMVARLTPLDVQRRTKEKLEQAHLQMGPGGFLLLKAGIGLILPLLLLSPSLRAGRFGFRELLLGLALLFLGTRLPDLLLGRKISARQSKIRKSLADALDLITICVEAGYGLDAALAKVTEKTKGPLAEELSRALLEINLGKPRGQALRDMAQRAKVAEFQAFIATLVQAEQMGVSIADILRVQSDSMRVRRRQIAEEAAMKAPVKMLFPLVLFIFPAMFVVILGPTVIKIIDSVLLRPPG